MLQVSINYAQQIRISLRPTVHDRTRQSTLALASEDADPGIARRILARDFCSAIFAVVINNNEFVINRH